MTQGTTDTWGKMLEDWRGCKAKDDINMGDLPDRAARSSGGWREEVARTIRPVASTLRDTFVRGHRRVNCWRINWRFDIEYWQFSHTYLGELDWGFPAGCRPQRPPLHSMFRPPVPPYHNHSAYSSMLFAVYHRTWRHPSRPLS